MSNAPGAVAKAFLDALPSLDYNKLVSEARRNFGIVVLGDEGPADELLRLLRGSGELPRDVKLAVWRHTPGTPPPIALGKTELALIVPATEDYHAQARESFAGVPTLSILLEGGKAPEGVTNAITLSALDADQVRAVVVPELVDRLWERRLALGRAFPATRDRIAGKMIQRAVRDVRVLLGSVAGAGGGRSGAPTAATAQLLMHQASLVVSLAAIYGISLEDRKEIFRRVASKLAPTLVLDGAEAGVSKLASGLGGEKYGKLYGALAAYVTRPALSATSTVLAGLIARQVFRGGSEAPGVLRRTVERTRHFGKQALSGAGQGVVVVAGALGTRLRSGEHNEAAGSEEPSAGESPSTDSRPEDERANPT